MKLSTRNTLLSLVGCLLIGCAQASKNALSTEERAITLQAPLRVIITFSQSPAVESNQLTSVISETCRCHPVLFRQYNSNALIYEIRLPQNYPYAIFEKSLLDRGVSLGIKAVEEDVRMQHQ